MLVIEEWLEIAVLICCMRLVIMFVMPHSLVWPLESLSDACSDLRVTQLQKSGIHPSRRWTSDDWPIFVKTDLSHMSAIICSRIPCVDHWCWHLQVKIRSVPQVLGS